MFIFFFSSRRRHTRYWRDWSSDVCSSDLEDRVQEYGAQEPQEGRDGFQHLVVHEGDQTDPDPGKRGEGRVGEAPEDPAHQERSEERRGGKECRYRWSPYH